MNRIASVCKDPDAADVSITTPPPLARLDLRAANLVPLWEVAANLVRTEPMPSCAPFLWEYSKSVRPALIEAGETISPEEAERRVLLLANPSLPNPAATSTLGAGFQMIKGGEIAESHRHTQAALRVVIEGNGAFTSVNGERFTMERGDLILTPSWTWHDHEKESGGPMIWFDGIDVPLMSKLSVSFYEEFQGGQVARSRPDNFSQSSYGHGLVPLDARFVNQAPLNHSAPQLRYPYIQARHALLLMQKGGAADASQGFKLRYANSATGGHVLPTIAAFLQLLPQGFTSRPKRQTDSEIFVVLEGSGCTHVGDQVFRWRENDVFVAPNWMWRHHVADTDAVLFSYSERALHETLGIWCEEIRA